MKKFSFLILFAIMAYSSFAQVDLTKKPEPVGTTDFKFPEFTTFNLSNGLKVFLVEDHEQPTIFFRILIQGGNSFDGNKPGVSSLLSDLLAKGAGQRNALQFAQATDGIGAGVSASAGLDYMTVNGSGLKKHMTKVLELMSDMLLKPTFPKDEFDKLIPLALAGLKDEKSKPMSVASRLIRKIIYGENHPYGKKETEESIKSIKLEDLKEYYNKYFITNNSTLLVVGDVNQNEIKPLLEKAFASWKAGDAAKITIPKNEPMPLGVYFVNRPASVQSTVMMVTRGLPVNADDYETLSLASSLMGSGFGGRLFRTLREKYSYTYTPFGRIGQNKYANTFVCGADVRNAVTDSAIDVIKEQMKIMATDPAEEEELNRIKKYEIGEYQMSFESSGFVGGLIQLAEFNKIPFEKVQNYSQIVSTMNPYQIKNIAAKYMNPDAAYLVVVGSPTVKEKLAKYGKIYEYDLDANPLTGENAKMEKVSMSAKDLVKKYTEAIGGKSEISKVKTMITEGKGSLSVQGRDMTGTIKIYNMAPNKECQQIEIGMIKQNIWCNGTDAWSEAFGTFEKKEGKELQKALDNAKMFKETEIGQGDEKSELLGKQGNEYLLKVTSKDGGEKVYYFDAATFLINKTEETEETPQGPMPVTVTYSNYQKFGGVMLPKNLETTFPMFTIKVENNYTINPVVEESIFSPNKK